MEKVQSKGKLKNLLFDHKGMTLIEAMGGLVILALTLVLIYSGFLTAQKVINHGDALEEQSQDAYASIEHGKASPGEEDTIDVALGGETLSFTGQYSEIEDEETNTGLYTFQSTTTPSTHNQNVADDVRNTFIDWINTLNSTNWWWRYCYGYPTISDYRTWVSDESYEGTWPTMDNDITLEHFHVQPYHYEPALVPSYASTDDVFVYATDTTGNDNWDNVHYIYDHEKHVWYYYTKNKGYNIDNQPWSAVKYEIHTNHPKNWRALN